MSWHGERYWVGTPAQFFRRENFCPRNISSNYFVSRQFSRLVSWEGWAQVTVQTVQFPHWHRRRYNFFFFGGGDGPGGHERCRERREDADKGCHDQRKGICTDYKGRRGAQTLCIRVCVSHRLTLQCSAACVPWPGRGRDPSRPGHVLVGTTAHYCSNMITVSLRCQ